jgi:hypothetical protein
MPRFLAVQVIFGRSHPLLLPLQTKYPRGKSQKIRRSPSHSTDNPSLVSVSPLLGKVVIRYPADALAGLLHEQSIKIYARKA